MIDMRKNFLILNFAVLMSLLLNPMGQYSCFAVSLSASVEKEHYIQFDKTNTVVDSLTGRPVSGASVSIPSKGVISRTNENGQFNLNVNLQGPTILSINAQGYKPFSLTITENGATKPLTIGITKESGKELVIDASLRHLGDNVFSNESANAEDFRLNSTGSYFHKEFYLDNLEEKKNVFLKIGSIIGVDTEIARKLNQGTAKNGISSPTKIYLNSYQIGELKINGDNQEILIPSHLLRPNNHNQLVIETGKNLYSRKRIDYDDIEFINLILEFK
ncbi:MAG: hypothetical protein A2104_06220 [Candidatus Melainabacteria bacterium GWF2_32_7]|nr:MAG: hypothetical protein A2104_06220 [Candidatus Melainabacteria bacterium GWF2_32_7]